MRIAIPAETAPGELRVALTPSGAHRLVTLGLQPQVQVGLGKHANFSDSDYAEAGAKIMEDPEVLLADAGIILRIRSPDAADLKLLPAGSIHLSFLDPFNNRALVDALATHRVSALSLEMIPRTTLAQKMDALSSQANLGGYVAVLLAADALPRIFPMMITPAGTIPPAKVYVIGAGVAGLQAIATARRLGARVEAFDTRPVVAEQVQSLGARFTRIDMGATGQTEQGYARELTPEQREAQRQGMKKVVAGSDVVITTAQLFGRPAPSVLTRDMVEAMRPGSVVVDMAVESGGNVEGSELDQVVRIGGVQVIGFGNLPARVARDASEMLSANLCHLVAEFWDPQSQSCKLDRSNAILRGCLVTHDGAVVNQALLGSA